MYRVIQDCVQVDTGLCTGGHRIMYRMIQAYVQGYRIVYSMIQDYVQDDTGLCTGDTGLCTG